MSKFRNKNVFNDKNLNPQKNCMKVNEFPLHISLFSLIVQNIFKKKKRFYLYWLEVLLVTV